MATPRKAIGSLLKIGDGASPEVFTTIGAINDITGPNQTASTIDTTSHDTTGGYTSYVTGLKDAGEVTFTLFFDANDTGHIGLQTTFDNNTLTNFQLAIAATSPAKKWTFAAYVNKLQFHYPVAGAQSADVTLKLTGKPTIS